MNAVKLYRVASWCHRKDLNFFSRIFVGIIFLLYNSYIPASCKIGRGTKFSYGGIGVVLHGKAVIGENCIIGQGVTLGRKKEPLEAPVIGNDVYISAGARILGNIVVGNNSIVGANAVVISDVPSNSIVAGVPARVIGVNETTTKDFFRNLE